MLAVDVMRESESEWASNCVVVFKKDRTASMCTDYRQLNKVTRKDSYPLCDIQTLFDCLHGSTYYTSLDLFSGYCQVEVDKMTRIRQLFWFRGWFDVFQRMPFGLGKAPTTFSRIVDTIFKDVKMKYLLPYLDDFTVYSATFQDHLFHLEEVLRRLASAGLEVKPSKCFFGQTKIAFLGHSISAGGVEPDSG